VVNQQLKELKMRKLNLFVVRPSDTREEVRKKFVEYLKKQGIKIVKEDKK
jgi:maleate cis-trans isomerase